MTVDDDSTDITRQNTSTIRFIGATHLLTKWLDRYLPALHEEYPDFATYCTRGYVLEKGTAYCPDQATADLVNSGNYKRGSRSDPYIRNLDGTLPIAAAPAASTTSAVPPTPSVGISLTLSTSSSSTTGTPTPGPGGLIVKVNRAICDRIDDRAALTITNSIDDRIMAKNLLRDHDGGRAIVAALVARKSKANNALSQFHTRTVDDVKRDGVPTCTHKAVTKFRHDLELAYDAQGTTISEAEITNTVLMKTRGLGTEVSRQIDIEMLKLMKPLASLTTGEIMDAVTDAVESFELDDNESHGKFGNDPNKNRKNNNGKGNGPPSKWKKGMTVCNGCGGQHLHKQCLKTPEQKAEYRKVLKDKLEKQHESAAKVGLTEDDVEKAVAKAMAAAASEYSSRSVSAPPSAPPSEAGGGRLASNLGGLLANEDEMCDDDLNSLFRGKPGESATLQVGEGTGFFSICHGPEDPVPLATDNPKPPFDAESFFARAASLVSLSRSVTGESNQAPPAHEPAPISAPTPASTSSVSSAVPAMLQGGAPAAAVATATVPQPLDDDDDVRIYVIATDPFGDGNTAGIWRGAWGAPHYLGRLVMGHKPSIEGAPPSKVVKTVEKAVEFATKRNVPPISKGVGAYSHMRPNGEIITIYEGMNLSHLQTAVHMRAAVVPPAPVAPPADTTAGAPVTTHELMLARAEANAHATHVASAHVAGAPVPTMAALAAQHDQEAAAACATSERVLAARHAELESLNAATLAAQRAADERRIAVRDEENARLEKLLVSMREHHDAALIQLQRQPQPPPPAPTATQLPYWLHVYVVATLVLIGAACVAALARILDFDPLARVATRVLPTLPLLLPILCMIMLAAAAAAYSSLSSSRRLNTTRGGRHAHDRARVNRDTSPRRARRRLGPFAVPRRPLARADAPPPPHAAGGDDPRSSSGGESHSLSKILDHHESSCFRRCNRVLNGITDCLFTDNSPLSTAFALVLLVYLAIAFVFDIILDRNDNGEAYPTAAPTDVLPAWVSTRHATDHASALDVPVLDALAALEREIGISAVPTVAQQTTPPRSAPQCRARREARRRQAAGSESFCFNAAAHLSASTHKRTGRGRYRRIATVVDSGCTWHITGALDNLINQRPCTDRITGMGGEKHAATVMGDMPMVMMDSKGNAHHVLLRGVRYVPKLPITLISVKQLWSELRIDSVFRDMNVLSLLDRVDDDGNPVNVPFTFEKGIYRLNVAIDQEFKGKVEFHGSSFFGSIHRAGASSHIRRLPSQLASDAMHRRLHIHPDYIRRLEKFTCDAPNNLTDAPHDDSCEHCKEANATRIPHSEDQYTPSYAGRLIHADIVGPFKLSRIGHYAYALILVDDHTRFKYVAFLQKKSDAPAEIRRFVATFNAYATSRKDQPIRVVGSLHSDNAGEFLSKDFTEALADDGIAHTTCPPHVHALNGVAERAIRSIIENARSNMVASQAPTSFWNYAIQHAVDVLNRSTGPPNSEKSSFELLTGDAPRIMQIMPWGCRTFTVKPRGAVSKTEWDSRAWVGKNLGRSQSTPGAYDVWVESLGRIVTSSECYFNETLFPWRPKGDQVIGSPVPTMYTDESEQPPGVPRAGNLEPQPVAEPSPPQSSVTSQFIESTRGVRRPATNSRHVLILFSGPYARPDGLATFLRQLGLKVTAVDNSNAGGGDAHDLLDDAFFQNLLRRCQAGEFMAVIAAPPCSTFSVSRFFEAKHSDDGGPPPVRDRNHADGFEGDGLPAGHGPELEAANSLVRRMVALVGAAFDVGAEYIIENPADRGDESKPFVFLDRRHAPLWLFSDMDTLRSRTGGQVCTFPMCAFQAPFQKYTSLMYSPGFSILERLNGLRCTHSSHEKLVGGERAEDGSWFSREAAAYPTHFNWYLARTCLELASQLPTPSRASPTSEPVRSRLDPFEEEEDAEPGTQQQRRVGRASDGSPGASTSRPHTAPPPPTPVPMASMDVAPLTPPRPERNASAPRVTTPIATPSPEPARAKPGGKQVWGQALEHGDHGQQGPRRSNRLNVAMMLFATGTSLVGSTYEAYQSTGRALHAASVSTPAGCARVSFDGYGGRASGFLGADPSEKLTRKMVMKDNAEKWLVSEGSEIANHLRNNSWTAIDRCDVPNGRRLVRMTWVYKVKRSGKLKSRLCVQGCTQIPGIDYDQTFCSTIRHTSLRLLASLAAKYSLKMRRWDFVSAYLQGELEEGEVTYCSLPPGAYDHFDRKDLVGRDGEEKVFRIDKPIYGMAQAGRRWQRTLFPWLTSKEVGFSQCFADNNIFFQHADVKLPDGTSRPEWLIIGCYVDDMFVLHSHDDAHSLYSTFVEKLEDRFEAEDEGNVQDLLNIEITREGDCVVLRQTSYIRSMVATYLPDGVPSDFQHTVAPCDDSIRQHVSDALCCVEAPDAELLKRYQKIVGSLIYCSVCTRPDIAYAVGMLCRCMGKPTEAMYRDACRVLCYLSRHERVGLRYEADDRAMYGHTDADWAVKHSTSGRVFMYNRAAISWGSKKQDSIALSSCESEIVAASEAAKDAVYLGGLLHEIGERDVDEPVSLATDNQAARNTAYNPEHHDRMKHVERRHFFVRECVENRKLVVPYVRTHDNLADFFTKPLLPKQFFALRNQIMNQPRLSSRDH